MSKRLAVINFYSSEKGYGFCIETSPIPDGSGKRTITFFFHVTSCNFIPEVGQRIAFNVGQGRRGVAAVDVELVEPVEPAIAAKVLAASTTTPSNGGVA